MIQVTNRPMHCKHLPQRTQFISIHTCSHSSPPDLGFGFGWVNFKLPDCEPPTGRLLALQITKFLSLSFVHFIHALRFLHILRWCVYISTQHQRDSVGRPAKTVLVPRPINLLVLGSSCTQSEGKRHISQFLPIPSQR